MSSEKITTRDEANAAYVHLFDAGEGYGPGQRGDGRRAPVEDVIDGMLDEVGAKVRHDLSADGLNVVQRGDGSLVGLRDDAGEGAWAIVIEVSK